MACSRPGSRQRPRKMAPNGSERSVMARRPGVFRGWPRHDCRRVGRIVHIGFDASPCGRRGALVSRAIVRLDRTRRFWSRSRPSSARRGSTRPGRLAQPAAPNPSPQTRRSSSAACFRRGFRVLCRPSSTSASDVSGPRRSYAESAASPAAGLDAVHGTFAQRPPQRPPAASGDLSRIIDRFRIQPPSAESKRPALNPVLA